MRLAESTETHCIHENCKLTAFRIDLLPLSQCVVLTSELSDAYVDMKFVHYDM